MAKLCMWCGERSCATDHGEEISDHIVGMEIATAARDHYAAETGCDDYLAVEVDQDARTATVGSRARYVYRRTPTGRLLFVPVELAS